MDAIVKAVLSGAWDREGESAALAVLLVLKTTGEGDGGAVRVLMWPIPPSSAPADLGTCRMLFGAPAALYERSDLTDGSDAGRVLEGRGSRDHVLVGLVPHPDMPPGASARVALRIIPKPNHQLGHMGLRHEALLTVRHGDVVVPALTTTVLPLVHSALVASEVSLLPQPRQGERFWPPRSLYAVVQPEQSASWLFAEHIAVPDAGGGVQRLCTCALSDRSPPLQLPDLRGALLDVGAERRTRQRARALQKELAEAVWHPRRVVARVAEAGWGALDAL